MSLRRRLSLLAALCLLSCGEAEDPEVCSTEHVVDDVEASPAAQKGLGNADESGSSKAPAASAPGKAGALQAR